jgi:hypothetical protein
MITIYYELNGEKCRFESTLNYSMIAVKDGLVCVPCFNYTQVLDFGRKNACSVEVIPCVSEGKSCYNNPVETYDKEKHPNFVWEQPTCKKQIIEQKPIEPKAKKLRKKRSKK